MKDKIVGFLATAMLFTFYLNYRVAKTFIFLLPVNSFNHWIHYSTKEDHVLLVLFDLIVLLFFFFGFWWALAVLALCYTAYFVIFTTKKWLKKRKKSTR